MGEVVVDRGQLEQIGHYVKENIGSWIKEQNIYPWLVNANVSIFVMKPVKIRKTVQLFLNSGMIINHEWKKRY